MIVAACILYVLSLAFVVFPTKIKTVNKITIVILFLSLLYIACIRDENSVNDYELYIGAWIYSTYEKTTIEASFLFIRDILRDTLQLHYKSIFIVYAILGVGTKFWGIKRLADNFYLAVLVYISHFFILHELTQMRAGVAAGFILIALKPLYDKNLKQYLIFIGLATLFHYSAALMLPLWFLNRDKNNKYFYYFLIPTGYIIYFLGLGFVQNIPIPYFQSKLDAYKTITEDESNKINVFNALFLLRILIYYVLVFNREKIAKEYKMFYFLLNIDAISLFVLPALAAIPAIAFRVHELLGVVEIILFSLLIYTFKPKIFGYIAVIIITLVFFLINLFYNKLIFN
ncbi:hypothetical protein J2787_003068 [Chryseobacterium rhizosphaerae]|uniref:EpsG family protein n=1 Tax=Chryseobacterium rhizosphaerae TaxID=395937 RepID=A0AAE3YCK2_9FLAO|nr:MULTISPECIES: EpsG family protein [Chryseobacterium]MBL3547348.1 EpsG family protein [Chryseobacterium sp. KMC2]MDR6527676.1 hypothetical protein [Chryseobacterium rhizosphaerae]